MGASDARDQAAFGVVGLRLGVVAGVLGGLHHLLRHGLHEVLVDGLLDGVGPGIHHLGRDGRGLLVHVIVQGGLGEIACQHAGEVAAEIGGNHDGGPVAALVHAVDGAFPIGELPAQIMIIVQVCHHRLAHVQRAGLGAFEAGVVVGHGHLHGSGVLIGIPVRGHDVPGVGRGDRGHAEHHHDGDGVAQHAAHVARENGEDDAEICPRSLQHPCPSAAGPLVGPTRSERTLSSPSSRAGRVGKVCHRVVAVSSLSRTSGCRRRPRAVGPSRYRPGIPRSRKWWIRGGRAYR